MHDLIDGLPNPADCERDAVAEKSQRHGGDDDDDRLPRSRAGEAACAARTVSPRIGPTTTNPA